MTTPIVALDVSSLEDVRRITGQLDGLITFYKVGLQLFTSEGTRAVEHLRKRGHEVFLDLKLLDIPQTVTHAVREAGNMGATSVSLHLWGGASMMKMASELPKRPKLWGVSVLTSLTTDDLRILGGRSTEELVPELAKMGMANGMDGLVCSGQELGVVGKLAPRPVTIIPGVRSSQDPAGDQKRTVTPAEAARAGADYVVIGRPITQAQDIRGAAERILAEIRTAR